MTATLLDKDRRCARAKLPKKTLCEWIADMREKGVAVTRDLAKCMTIVSFEVQSDSKMALLSSISAAAGNVGSLSTIENSDFKASDGWLKGFMRRYNLSYRKGNTFRTISLALNSNSLLLNLL